MCEQQDNVELSPVAQLLVGNIRIKRDPARGWYVCTPNGGYHLFQDGGVRQGVVANVYEEDRFIGHIAYKDVDNNDVSAFWETREEAITFYVDWVKLSRWDNTPEKRRIQGKKIATFLGAAVVVVGMIGFIGYVFTKAVEALAAYPIVPMLLF